VSVADSSFDRALQIFHTETTVCESSLRFSARTFVRMLTRIMQILVASGKPTTGQRQEAEIIL